MVCCQDLSLNLLAQLNDRSEGGPTNVRRALAFPALASFYSLAKKKQTTEQQQQNYCMLIWVDRDIPFCHELWWNLSQWCLLAQGHCRICLPWYSGVPKCVWGSSLSFRASACQELGLLGSQRFTSIENKERVCSILSPFESPVGKWLSSISKPLTAVFYFISSNGKGFPYSETFSWVPDQQCSQPRYCMHLLLCQSCTLT